jgi:hypothetical protein
MKAAVRPVHHTRDKPVFHGIEVDVIDVALQVRAITNDVFPIAPLPDSLLAL